MKSIQDYSAMVKKLKFKISDLEGKNEVLQSSLGMPVFFEPKTPNFKQLFQQGTSELYVKENVLKQLKRSCDERGMTMEMLYRCADLDQKGEVTVEKMKNFLNVFFSDQVEISLLLRIALLFDEDHSGVITKQEFYRTLIYNKCNGEDNPDMMRDGPLKLNSNEEEIDVTKIQSKVLEKFIELMRSTNQPPEMLYTRFDSQGNGYITAADMGIALSNNDFTQNNLLVLMKYFDVRKENKMMKDQFIQDLREILIPNIQASALIQMRLNNPGILIMMELRIFRNLLRQYNLNPITIFYRCEPNNSDKKKVVDLAKIFSKNIPQKDAPEAQLVKWMKLIDSSADGWIDVQELKLSLLTEEDLMDGKTMQSFRVDPMKTDEFSQEQLIKQMMLQINEQNIQIDQFFDWMDTDKNGIISLVELKKGLLALKIQIGDTLKIMKIFDRNDDGIVDVVEFYQTLHCDSQANEIIQKRSAIKLKNLFDHNSIDFVSGMKNLFFFHTSKEDLVIFDLVSQTPIISREEFLFSLDKIQVKANLTDEEVYKMMESADTHQNNQIDIINYCTLLYYILFPERQ